MSKYSVLSRITIDDACSKLLQNTIREPLTRICSTHNILFNVSGSPVGNAPIVCQVIPLMYKHL